MPITQIAGPSVVVNGGNSLGADLTIGTNDAYSLIFETNGTERARFTPTGELIVIGPIVTINSTVVDITDRVFTVNKSAGANDPVPSLMAGLSVYRGAVAGVARDKATVIWDEPNSRWNFALNTGADEVTIGADQSVKLASLLASSSIRQLTNNSVFSGRNAANSADVEVARVDTSDRVSIAQGGADVLLGSGGLVWGGAANKALSLTAAGTGTVDVQSATGAIRIGTTNSARSVALGTGAAAQTVTIGSANTTSSIGFSFGTNGVAWTQGAATSSTPAPWTFTGAAHTGLANAEANDVNWDFNRTVTFSGGGGAIANQRAIRIQAPTYAAAAAQTITTASTVEISGQPVQGANVTLSAVGVSAGAYALNVSSGNSRFGGSVYLRDTATGPGVQGLYLTDSSGNGFRVYQLSSTQTFWTNQGSTNTLIVQPAVAIQGSVLNPFSDAASDLGGPSNRWRDVYTQRTQIKNHAAFTGSWHITTSAAAQTTTATTTTLFTLAIPDNSMTWIRATIIARATASNDQAMYTVLAPVSRYGGGAATVVLGAVTQTSVETVAGWDGTIAVSGNNAIVQVTSTAVTINWVATIEYQTVTTNT